MEFSRLGKTNMGIEKIENQESRDMYFKKTNTESRDIYCIDMGIEKIENPECRDRYFEKSFR